VIKIPKNIYIVYNAIQKVYAINLRNSESFDSAEPERFKNVDQAIDYLRQNGKIRIGERKVELIISGNAPDEDYTRFEGLVRTVKKLSIRKSEKIDFY